jgi:arabinose-5-phosphate isomerase
VREYRNGHPECQESPVRLCAERPDAAQVARAVERTDPRELPNLVAEAFMTRGPVTVGTEELACHALQPMERRASRISVLAVTDGGRCVGMLRLHDIVRSGL